jgi:hypothetical protein
VYQLDGGRGRRGKCSFLCEFAGHGNFYSSSSLLPYCNGMLIGEYLCCFFRLILIWALNLPFFHENPSQQMTMSLLRQQRFFILW